MKFGAKIAQQLARRQLMKERSFQQHYYASSLLKRNTSCMFAAWKSNRRLHRHLSAVRAVQTVPPQPHLLCKIISDKSKARENQGMTMKDNIRPSLLNYLPPFCHVSFATELSAPTPHQPASITLPVNFQSPGFSPAKPGGFSLNSWRVDPSFLFKCLRFSLVRTPPKSQLLPAPSQSA